MCGMWLFIVYLISFIEKHICTQADNNAMIAVNVWASTVRQFNDDSKEPSSVANRF